MSWAQKYIDHRIPSAAARCYREIGRSVAGYALWCGSPLQLVVTKNPTRLPYEELVMIRCMLGHIDRGDGVLPEVPVEESDGA